MNSNKKKNKGGRPVKGAAEKLKYRITVKTATEDYYLLKSKAQSAGVSVSEFIRGCITEGGVRERLSKEHGDLIRKLCGMANNLNQIAKICNRFFYTPDALELTKLDEDLCDCRKEMVKGWESLKLWLRKLEQTGKA